MKVNKIAVLAALALGAGAAHAVITKPQPVLAETDKEIVDFCKLFPQSEKCKNDTDGGNGGGNEPPKQPMDIIQLRDSIQHYELYMQLIACMAYIIRFRTADTFVYMCVGILVLTPIHIVYEKQLLELATDPEYRALVRNIWYIGYALTNVLLVTAVVLISKKEGLKFDYASRLMATSFLTLAVIQVVRYIDRIVIETDLLGVAYSIAIPTINLGVTFTIIFASIAAIVVGAARGKG